MIYFDNAATSRFKPSVTLDAVMEELASSSNPGRGGHNDSIKSGEKVFEVRKKIKEFFNADDRYEVVFTKNCTEALNLALMGYLSSFSGKVHVITSQLEHNSILRVLFELERRGKVSISFVEYTHNYDISIPAIEKLVRRNTVLVALSHMSNVIGNRIDVKAISNHLVKRRIPLLIDGAQSIGHVAIDLKESPITMLASAGHKGLYGVQGTGFLLFNRESVKPLPITYGGTGTDSQSLFQPDGVPERYESGTVNTAGIVGLGKSVSWVKDNFDAINNKIYKISTYIYNTLYELESIELYTPYPSPVISFNISGLDSVEVANYLNDKDIAVRAGLHCAPLAHKMLGTFESGAVRISVGYSNTVEEAQYLVDTIKDIISEM
ncbi:MAG: aminotransferase class V-fold PLP-dependent enzyme [Clostridia bacterium]|nr:aminotransferase class V-fold PLP-dependent enzyme [Clostridia bacterium]